MLFLRFEKQRTVKLAWISYFFSLAPTKRSVNSSTVAITNCKRSCVFGKQASRRRKSDFKLFRQAISSRARRTSACESHTGSCNQQAIRRVCNDSTEATSAMVASTQTRRRTMKSKKRRCPSVRKDWKKRKEKQNWRRWVKVLEEIGREVVIRRRWRWAKLQVAWNCAPGKKTWDCERKGKVDRLKCQHKSSRSNC